MFFLLMHGRAAAGFDEAKELARSEGQEALRSLADLPLCAERTALELMVDYVLKRIN